MATKEMSSEARTAATADQSGSRAGAKSRVRRSGIGLPQHQPAEEVVARGGSRFARGAAVEEHEDAVGDGAELVEVQRDEDHRRAVGGGLPQRIVNAARGAQVQPA